jgi:hypothetical protein
MHPARALIRPITAILIMRPRENERAIEKTLFVDTRPCLSINPAMSGMFDR